MASRQLGQTGLNGLASDKFDITPWRSP